jgi:hypothetical protein
VEQTDQEIEHIARAFFAARNEAEVWENASRTLKHDFRLYARQAISMLERRQDHTHTEVSKGTLARSYEAA